MADRPELQARAHLLVAGMSEASEQDFSFQILRMPSSLTVEMGRSCQRIFRLLRATTAHSMATM